MSEKTTETDTTTATKNIESASTIYKSRPSDLTVSTASFITESTPELNIASSSKEPYISDIITETKKDTATTAKNIESASTIYTSRSLDLTVSAASFPTESTPELKIASSSKEPYISHNITENKTDTATTTKNKGLDLHKDTSRLLDLTVSTVPFTKETTPEMIIIPYTIEPSMVDKRKDSKVDDTSTTKNTIYTLHIDSSNTLDLSPTTLAIGSSSENILTDLLTKKNVTNTEITSNTDKITIPILSSHINPLSTLDEALKPTTYQTETILERPVKEHLTGKKVKVAQTDTTTSSITTNFTNSLTNIHPSASLKAHNHRSKSSNTTTLSSRTSQHPFTTTPSIILVPPTIRNGIAVTTDTSSSKNSPSTTSNPTAGTSAALIVAAILASSGTVLLCLVCGILALRRRRNKRKERTLLDNGRDKRGGYHQIKMSDLSEND